MLKVESFLTVVGDRVGAGGRTEPVVDWGVVVVVVVVDVVVMA